MRFLIVTPLVPPEPGGPSYYSVALRSALERAGESVDLIAFAEVRRYWSGVRHLVFLYKVLVRAVPVDTLIILDTVSVALPAVIAGYTLGKQTIIRTGGDFVWERYVERTGEKVLLSEFYRGMRALSYKERLLRWVQQHVVFGLVQTIAYSTAWQRDVWREPYAISDQRTAVIENSYPPKGLRAPGGAIFLAAWRETAFKNMDTLERAYAIARARDPRVTLEILKNVPREELTMRMRTARALVVPSLSEVSPNMAMEALALGVPVIMTTECGTADRFGDAVVTVDPRDVEAIADALCAFMDAGVYAQARERAAAFNFTRTYDDVAADFVALAHHR